MIRELPDLTDRLEWLLQWAQAAWPGTQVGRGARARWGAGGTLERGARARPRRRGLVWTHWGGGGSAICLLKAKAERLKRTGGPAGLPTCVHAHALSMAQISRELRPPPSGSSGPANLQLALVKLLPNAWGDVTAANEDLERLAARRGLPLLECGQAGGAGEGGSRGGAARHEAATALRRTRLLAVPGVWPP